MQCTEPAPADTSRRDSLSLSLSLSLSFSHFQRLFLLQPSSLSSAATRRMYVWVLGSVKIKLSC